MAATQNPVEYEGTYPLPEAQLDRFLLKVVLPIPRRARPSSRSCAGTPPGFDPRDVAGAGVTAGGRSGATSPPGGRPSRRVQVSPEVAGYIVDIARATRESPSLSLGVSPRGATALLRAARAWAWLTGRDFVTPDDVKALAHATLVHRLGLRPEAELEGVDVGAGARLRARLGAGPALSTADARRWPSPAGCRSCCCWAWCPVVLRPEPGHGLAVAARGRGCWCSPTGCWRRRRARLSFERRPVGHGAARAPRRDAAASSTNAGRAPGPRRASATPGSRRPAPRTTGTGSGSAPATGARCGPPLLPRRRGDLRAVGRDRPAARAARAGRAAAHPSTCRARSARCRRSSRASTCPSRLARLRDLDGRAAVRVRGQGTEFDSLREYVRGDDVRSIDWRASARNRNVVVRTWQPERDRRVVLVLDTSRTSAGRVEDVPRLDSAMDAALLLAALAARAGDRIDFVAGDRRVRARLRSAGARDVAARPPGHDGRPRAGDRRGRLGRRWPAPSPGSAGSARSSCSSPRWSRPRSRRGCCRCCPR